MHVGRNVTRIVVLMMTGMMNTSHAGNRLEAADEH